eukprot:12921716-Prorocentrum_lima.AAC.1
MAQSLSMLFRRAIGEKRRHPVLILTRKWWMQQYIKVQDLINEENIHQTSPFPKSRVRNPISGPLKAKVV